MNKINQILTLTRLEVLQFLRSKKFVYITLLTIFFGMLTIAPDDSPIHILNSHKRGIYNSAWIGLKMALFINSFFYLIAFFFIRNTIYQDKINNLDVFISSSSIGKGSYLVYKQLSKFFIMFIITFILIISAGFMQLYRGEDLNINVINLFKVWFFTSLPALFFIASLSVLFESVKFLRNIFGGIVFIILGHYLLYYSLMQVNNVNIINMDVFGVGYFIDYMGGFILLTNRVHGTFLIDNVVIEPCYMYSRLFIIFLGIIILTISIFLFKGIKDFKPYKKKKFDFFKNKMTLLRDRDYVLKDYDIKKFINDQETKYKFNFFQLVSKEINIIINNKYALIVLNLIFIFFIFIFQKSETYFFVYNFSFFLSYLYVSNIISKEYKTRVQNITFYINNFSNKQFFGSILAGFIVLNLSLSGIIIKSLLEAKYIEIIYIMIIEFMIIITAYFFGLTFKSTNILDIIVFFLAYSAFQQKTEIIYILENNNFIYYLLFTIILMFISYLIRNLQIRYFKG